MIITIAMSINVTKADTVVVVFSQLIADRAIEITVEMIVTAKAAME